MSQVLVVAEHDNQTLQDVSLHCIAAARQLSDAVCVLVAGDDCQPVIEQLLNITGVEKIYYANHVGYRHLLAETLAPLIAHLGESMTHVLAPASSFGKNLLPRAAALLDVDMCSDVVEILDEQTFVRPIYAGNILATVLCEEDIKLLTIRHTAFSKAESGAHKARVELVDFCAEQSLSSYVSADIRQEEIELTSARIVVSGGRGVGSKELFARLVQIAKRLNAAVGASRAAVDAGLAPNDWQVGQTGKVVAPQLYIAMGISGAIQHVAGMKDSKIIVAINNDEDAPIFKIADYGLVADLEMVIDELETALHDFKY